MNISKLALITVLVSAQSPQGYYASSMAQVLDTCQEGLDALVVKSTGEKGKANPSLWISSIAGAMNAKDYAKAQAFAERSLEPIAVQEVCVQEQEQHETAQVIAPKTKKARSSKRAVLAASNAVSSVMLRGQETLLLAGLENQVGAEAITATLEPVVSSSVRAINFAQSATSSIWKGFREYVVPAAYKAANGLTTGIVDYAIPAAQNGKSAARAAAVNYALPAAQAVGSCLAVGATDYLAPALMAVALEALRIGSSVVVHAKPAGIAVARELAGFAVNVVIDVVGCAVRQSV